MHHYIPLYSFSFFVRLIGLCFILTFLSCEPYQTDDIELGELPASPVFTVSVVPDNPNLVIVEDQTAGAFSRVWDLPGSSSSNSSKTLDTIFYALAGDYVVTLYIADENGGGTSSSSQSISISQNACTDELILLLGNCGVGDSKCWTFSTAAGAITVGPNAGSSEWFTSNENSLQAEQYDDSFCFTLTGNSFMYLNNGLTIDPWNDYAAVNYNPPADQIWTLSLNTGPNNSMQLILSEGAFMGVWDSGPVYNIVSLTETDMILQSEIIGTDGWFELYFKAE